MPRPEISGELKQEVAGLTAEDFNVPSHRVSFEDRVRMLLEKYRDAEERVEKLEEKVGSLQAQVQNLQSKQTFQNSQQSSRR